MIYVIRYLWPIYLLISFVMLVALVSETLFEDGMKVGEFLKRLVLCIIWPITLFSAKGRINFKTSFRKLLA